MNYEGLTELGGLCKDLQDLPSYILDRVYEYATATPSVVTFDLDSRSVTGIDLRPLQVDVTLCFYKSMGSVIAQTNTITLQSSTTESSTTFDRKLLQPMKSQHGIRQYSALAQISSAARKPESPLVIELHFSITANAALCDLEIDIKGLMSILSRSSSIVIRIFLTCAYNAKQTEVFDVDVDKLGVNLFFVLFDILRQWSAGLKSKKGADLLSVRINGRGSLGSVTCSNSKGTERFTAENRVGQYTRENLRSSGYRRVAMYWDLVNSIRIAVRGSDWGEMINFMRVLRDTCWENWGTKRPPPSLT